MRRSNKFRRHPERGQGSIETGLMIIVIFMLIFWIFELCNLIYTYSVMGDAVHEGVRYAQLLHSVDTVVVADDSRVKARVLTYAQISLHNVSAMTTTVELPDTTADPPKRVRVTITYTFVPYLSQYFPNPPTMHTYAEGRLIQ